MNFFVRYVWYQSLRLMDFFVRDVWKKALAIRSGTFEDTRRCDLWFEGRIVGKIMLFGKNKTMMVGRTKLWWPISLGWSLLRSYSRTKPKRELSDESSTLYRYIWAQQNSRVCYFGMFLSPLLDLHATSPLSFSFSSRILYQKYLSTTLHYTTSSKCPRIWVLKNCRLECQKYGGVWAIYVNNPDFFWMLKLQTNHHTHTSWILVFLNNVRIACTHKIM